MAAALLGMLIPGTGHLLIGRRRLAVIFVIPFGVLVAATAAVLVDGGLFGLLAVVVTPGVLPALALLNVVVAAWRIVSGVDAASRVERSRRTAGVLVVIGFGVVVLPHVVLGQAIASTNDLLDGLFASGGPATELDDGAATSGGELPGNESGDGTAPLVLPELWWYDQDELGIEPSSDPAATIVPGATLGPPSPRPTSKPLPKGPYTGGGGGNLPALGAAVPWPAPGATPWGNDGRFTLLLLGSDAGSDRWSRRMDVMLLVEVDVATGEIAMVGLPRNLQNVPLPPGPARAGIPCACFSGLLNEIYVEATVRHPDRWPGTGAIKGIGAVRAVIQELTGRPIDAVLVADLMGVVRVVDAMGGVDITVPSPVYDDDYPDPILGTISLRIPAGKQHMNGRIALAYARSRHQDSDYSRMARQQTLLLAIRSQLGPATILQAPALVTAAKGSAWTDLPRESLPALVQLFGKADTGRVHQLRIVPPRYPTWLTSSAIAQIRRDIAGLLPPVPDPTPTPEPTDTPEPSSSAAPTSSTAPSPSAAPTAGSSPTPTPGATPAATASQAPTPAPSPTPTPAPSPTASPP
jgi:LCP family protein required for cell wall assembly